MSNLSEKHNILVDEIFFLSLQLLALVPVLPHLTSQLFVLFEILIKLLFYLGIVLGHLIALDLSLFVREGLVVTYPVEFEL